MNEQSLLLWLEHHIGFESYKHLGGRSLDRIEFFFRPYKEALKINNVKICTIAGTNGKGQTSYSAASILQFFNFSYSLFISPHVHSLTERFQTHNGQISINDLHAYFQIVDARQKKENIQLSFFEFLFACFLEMSLNDKVSVLLLEVGVGGRLDATNLLDADVAIITSIGRDHQDLLGKRLDGILIEKMGIARSGKILLTALNSQYLRNLCSDISKQKKIQHQDIATESDVFHKSNKKLAYLGLKHLLPELPWDSFKFDKFIDTFQELPGRGEVLSLGKCRFHLYGSHNLDGMRAWLKSNIIKYDVVVLGFSKRSCKDISAMITLWARCQSRHPELYGQIIVSTFSHFKAFDPNPEEEHALRNLVTSFNQSINWISNWQEYVRLLKINEISKNFLIMGSFYFVSEFKSKSQDFSN